jgi:isocitrate/isopropylmalate dehydrogenase
MYFKAFIKYLQEQYFVDDNEKIDICLLAIKRSKTVKIVRFVFELAKQDQRKTVTAIDPANMM